MDRDASHQRDYWRSLEERADTPEFRAFLEEQVSSNPSEWLGPTTRRDFFKLMGASLGMAGLTACRWPEEKILPYTGRPAGRMDGVPSQYATTFELGGNGRGLVVTSYDGRPIKIEGNPLHPENRGGTDALTQATVLEMYDPERSRSVLKSDGRELLSSSWPEFEQFVAAHFAGVRAGEGANFAILAEASSSPTLARLRGRLHESMPGARWFEYEAISRDVERESTGWAFGQPMRVHYRPARARVVVSFDEDLLGTHPAAITNARDLVGARTGEARLDGHGQAETSELRLYVVEPAYTLTGAMADHRLAVLPSEVGRIAAGVALEVATHVASPVFTPSVRAALEARRGSEPLPAIAVAMVADLVRHGGRALVAVGPSQSPAVQAIGHLLNSALGSIGTTVLYTADPEPTRLSHVESIRALREALTTGEIGTLLILGGNPAHDAPVDLDFGAAMARAEVRIRLGLYVDETSELCTWHLPRAHYLESWGDSRAYDGSICAQQPLIEPLFAGRTPIEVIGLVLDEPARKGYDLMRGVWAELMGPEQFEPRWRQALHDGVVTGTGFAPITPALQADALAARMAGAPAAPKADGFELAFLPDLKFYDGRFANNPWLQEMPDPISKLTWDNALLVDPSTASELGVKDGDVLRVTADGRVMDAPVWVQPGQAKRSLAITLGHGRAAAGKIAEGAGFDAFRLRTSNAQFAVAGVQVERAGRSYKLVSTQDHHAIDKVGEKERTSRVHELVREGTVAEFQHHPEFAKHIGPHAFEAPLWNQQAYDGYKWGMAIDLNSCTGCGSCVVACQAENNIPVVGKTQVGKGREMHWIRVDRYFAGNPEEAAIAYQPVTCQHCENAPCEQVCPVAATVHSHEGLNDQVYNRCIGTRYCSNNCPYKVRRFNFFNYHKHLTPLEKMQFNPEVTVRARGVMEKCTYCVQRINSVKIRAKNDQRRVRDGEITPACAQACPTQAIAFGDLNDPESRVRKAQDHPRAYSMLAELFTRPRTVYLARLRNPVDGGAEHGHEGDTPVPQDPHHG